MPVSPGTPHRPRRSSWRLRLVVGAIVTAIAGAAISGWLIARTSAPPSGPVILISIDSLRADRLAAYGRRRAATPNLDALAAASIVFERAYSHSPLTLPAHVSILSGRLPFETGVRDDEGDAVPAKLPLLPALLHRRGFKTAGIVSSGLLTGETGLAAAFDFYDGEVPPRPAGTPAVAARRDGAATLEVAKRWIEQQGNRFFLFLHFDEPRAPFAGAPQAAGDPYEARVAQADRLVGQLVAFLKARGFYDRAIIVVTADHGQALGEHGETGHGVFLYDSTLRTPLFVKMPKNERGGSRRAQVVQQIDIAPTILDLMGAPRPSSLRGRSLRHLLDSDTPTLSAPAVYAESLYPSRHFGWSPLQSITDSRYRYIRAPRPELYDLQQDPGERENIAALNPAKVQELSALLDKVLAAAPPAPPSRLSEQDRLALAPPARGEARAANAPGAASSAEVGSRPTGAVSPRPSAEGGSPAEAEQQAAPPADPKDRTPVLARLRDAQALADSGKSPEAIAAYRAVVAADAGMPDAWQQLGSLLLDAGEADEALAAFREALRVNAEDLNALLGAGKSLARLGRFDEAARLGAIAVKLDPVQANELLARVALRQKDYAAAQRAAEASRQADPNSPMPAFVRGVELYQSGKYQDALPRFEEALQQCASARVQMPDVRFYAGDTLARLKKYADAEARLADELKWFPRNVRARESLALVYSATGRSEEAAAAAADLVRQVPTPEGYAAANRICTLLGDKGTAAAVRAEGRKLFGEAALHAAEAAPRQ